MSSVTSSSGSHAAEPDDIKTLARKRRFMIRLVTVLVGGMFLDGYILGIIGPISGTRALTPRGEQWLRPYDVSPADS